MENKKKEDKKEEEAIDFYSKIIPNHHVKSRNVKESDIERVLEDAHILYNICYTQCGLYGGAKAMAHCQITKDDPLRFFVTADKKIIINPVIVNHTKTTVDSKEGCITFNNLREIVVQRWNKVEVEYEVLDKDLKFKKIRENISGPLAKVYQHEIDHFDSINIYGIIST